MLPSERKSSVYRVSVTLDPIDVDLIDRLARLERLNRSEELRSILIQLRPMLQATVSAFETAEAQRDILSQKAAEMSISSLEALLPEVEKLGDFYLGIMSRLEGAAAASAAGAAPASNTGATLE